MKYIFFLGRTPELSAAEIRLMLKKNEVRYETLFFLEKFLIIDSKDGINAEEMLVQMGGTIKISQILGEFKNLNEATAAARSAVDELIEARETKKIIGYNIYFNEKTEKDKANAVSSALNDFFTSLKKELSEVSSIRLVYPDDSGNISSVSAIKNKFQKKGISFDFIFFPGKIILSKLLAIQDIQSYSSRDYGRPLRDAKIGMTPPKLAQIMINLAGLRDGETVYDPFCGIGTIMQEALLNDYRVIGSDANSQQVEKCKTNLEWISKQYVLKYPDYKVFQSDAAYAFKKIRGNSINAIVTETTLGPVYAKTPNIGTVKQNFREIEKLYLRFFQNARIILQNGGRVVFSVPAYQINSMKFVLAPFIDNIQKIGYSMISFADVKSSAPSPRITGRSTIIYSRRDQIVAREIIVFEKK